MIKDCVHCGLEFDVNSVIKRQVGGKINECPDCVEELGTETAIKHRGISSFGTNEVHIMTFSSEEELKHFEKLKEKESAKLD